MRPGPSCQLSVTRSSPTFRRDHFASTTTTSGPLVVALSSSPAFIDLDRVGSHGVYNYHQCAEEGSLSILAGRCVLAVCMAIVRSSVTFSSGVAATIAASITQ